MGGSVVAAGALLLRQSEADRHWGLPGSRRSVHFAWNYVYHKSDGGLLGMVADASSLLHSVAAWGFYVWLHGPIRHNNLGRTGDADGAA